MSIQGIKCVATKGFSESSKQCFSEFQAISKDEDNAVCRGKDVMQDYSSLVHDLSRNFTPFIIIIGGPTASGKSGLAIKLAKVLNTEIISADSMQIYRGLDIGTAKITATQGIKHNLIDIIDPYEEFSVSDYVLKADAIIKRMHSDGKIPIICGGTAFYLDALVRQRSFSLAKKDNTIRECYQEYLAKNGSFKLYQLLMQEDPAAAAKIHQNDTKRVMRALEIFKAGGLRKSEIEMLDSRLPNRYEYLGYCPDVKREELYSRINDRVDTMFDQGLIGETQELINSGVNIESQALQAIGYKETIEYLNNKYSLHELKELVKQRTRNYAKRQITFFKKFDMQCIKYDEHGIAKIISDIEARING